MENASKALLMAAGMLIAVLVASMFALMFSTMSEYTKAYDERKQKEQLQAFNGQFEKYVQDGATAQDIVTVINLAKAYNKKMEYEETDAEYYIKVNVNGNSIRETSGDEEKHTFLIDNSTYNDSGVEKVKMYSVILEKSNITGKVKHVTFTEM